jgi:hypothetical protein
MLTSLELKNTLNEVKTAIESINSRVDPTEERNSSKTGYLEKHNWWGIKNEKQ